MASRQTINSSVKAQVIQQLKAGKITMDQVVDKYKVQPYQVYAWVGQGMLKGELVQAPTVNPSSVDVPAPSMPQSSPQTLANAIERLRLSPVQGSSSLSNAIDPELARLIGEWWLRERLPRRLAGEG